MESDIVVIGAGAAGLAAARRLVTAGRTVTVLEARNRLGGRAWTHAVAGLPLDLGCGWLHTADENEWGVLADQLGFTVDPLPAPWERAAHAVNFPLADQQAYLTASKRFYARLAEVAKAEDRAAASLLEPGERWSALLNAVSTYANGVELDRLSVVDFSRYRDSGVNRRIVEGYGALIAAFGNGLDIQLGCPVSLIDHSGTRLKIETSQGTISARAAIVSVPTNVLAAGALRFSPELTEKIAAAEALPLGLADKLFLSVERPEDFPAESRVFGAVDRMTATYHLRPFGRPVIEAYVGGALARDLERDGPAAFEAFAIDELASVFGNAVRPRLRLIAATAWGSDPFALGSYSHARIGHADARAVLAAPVDGRLFFCGEACSRRDFTTAHGAYRTGLTAAEQVLATPSA